MMMMKRYSAVCFGLALVAAYMLRFGDKHGELAFQEAIPWLVLLIVGSGALIYGMFSDGLDKVSGPLLLGVVGTGIELVTFYKSTGFGG